MCNNFSASGCGILNCCGNCPHRTCAIQRTYLQHPDSNPMRTCRAVGHRLVTQPASICRRAACGVEDLQPSPDSAASSAASGRATAPASAHSSAMLAAMNASPATHTPRCTGAPRNSSRYAQASQCAAAAAHAASATSSRRCTATSAAFRLKRGLSPLLKYWRQALPPECLLHSLKQCPLVYPKP